MIPVLIILGLSAGMNMALYVLCREQGKHVNRAEQEKADLSNDNKRLMEALARASGQPITLTGKPLPANVVKIPPPHWNIASTAPKVTHINGEPVV